jgi:CHAD domain-containing protein
MKPFETEREYRFDVPEGMTFRKILEALPREIRTGDAVEEGIADTYMDTPALDLLSAGFGCRVRSIAGADKLELKFEEKRRDTTLSTRREWILAEGKPARLHASRILGNFFDSEFGVGLPGKAVSFLILQTKRTAVPVTFGASRLRLLLDHTRASSTISTLTAEFTEIELELLSEVSGADAQTLEELLGCILALKRVQPSVVNKIQKALALLPGILAESGKPVYLAEEPVGGAAPVILRHHFGKALRNEFGTRVGIDSEYLHDMRVSVRKLRSALSFFGQMLYAGDFVRLKGGLCRLADSLGQVRDCDVFLENLDSLLPEDFRQAHSGSMERIRSMVLAMREERHEKMLFELSRPREREFIAWCSKLFSAAAFRKYGETSCLEPAGVFASRLLLVLLNGVGKKGRKLLEDFDTAGDTTIHRMRIRFKKLRYAVEFFQPVIGEKNRALASALPFVQDAFGTFVDTFFTLDFTDELIRRAGFGKSASKVLDGLIEMKSQTITRKAHLRMRLRETLSAFLKSDVYLGAVGEVAGTVKQSGLR